MIFLSFYQKFICVNRILKTFLKINMLKNEKLLIYVKIFLAINALISFMFLLLSKC